jgi:AcrR family transcriptional regulator
MNASRHGKADVLTAAMLLLDEVGLPDLTMRRLATTLDVQPSALYWHYANKQSLLAEVSNTIVGFAKPVSPAETWQETTKLQAIALRDALLAFRDGAEVVSSTLALGLGADSALEKLEESMAIEDRALAHAAAESILFLVLGQVWHEQQRMQANSLGVVDNLNLSGTPNLEIGIQLILNGLSEKVKA